MFGSCGPVPEELLGKEGSARADVTKTSEEVRRGLAFCSAATGRTRSEAAQHMGREHTCRTPLSHDLQGSFRPGMCQAGVLGVTRVTHHSRRNHHLPS